MKISGEDYAALQRGLIDTLTAHGMHPFMVQSIQHAWDVFHQAWSEKRIDGDALYKKYNDAHFESAFRRIFKNGAT